MVGAVMLRETGAPEFLRFESVPVGTPAPDEVLLRQTAIGVNFHDTYVRSGLYQTLPLPGIPGIEAVGVVEAIGSRVRDVSVGDRVGYVTRKYGAYAEARVIAADRVIRLPAELDDRTAAAALTKGLTAWMLLSKVRTLRRGETCLVHAAAGGVGRLLCQWANHLGAVAIGTAGSQQKAEIALRNGCAHVVLYREDDFVARARRADRRTRCRRRLRLGADVTPLSDRCTRWRCVATWSITVRPRVRSSPSPSAAWPKNRTRSRAPCCSITSSRPLSGMKWRRACSRCCALPCCEWRSAPSSRCTKQRRRTASWSPAPSAAP